ncbi:conserved hypothetical protein [Theileria equi strain WA]|uniref:Signal peptide-containing protein n=1 Tax=Theileria equi strain WA TaxID=1537102 RepID=L1LBC3_THEEQ|nr:conserved hypothetical protein [Theileria equi strain WA]EKX72631.1 conserved hypothetical protein [Theileria equi strain WA]|eukprot:XP_004832083.1 conserved hypothetical protein [Theileria equi strain WA]
MFANLFCISLSGGITLLLGTARVASNYKFNETPSHEEYLSKDISDISRIIHLEEIDSIPWETEQPGNSSSICTKTLQSDYENAVYGLSEHFGCDVNSISSALFDYSKHPLSGPPLDHNLQNKQHIGTTPGCTRAKLAARCSSFLKLANCIYSNYIEYARKAKTQLALSNDAIKVFEIYPNNNLINKYNSVAGGGIGFLFREFLGSVCAFVHNACDLLHPQFKFDEEHRKSQACIVFDIITPLKGYNSLFDKALPAKRRLELVTEEKKAFLNYYNHRVPELVLSQIDIPLLEPFNKSSKLRDYRVGLCNTRCQTISQLHSERENNKEYSAAGRYRIYAICVQLAIYCNICKLCESIGVKLN